MIQVYNTKYLHDLPFEEYLKIPGHSFSSFKDAPPVETEGMRIGKLVHTYLLQPAKYNYEEYDIVAPIASELLEVVGMPLLRKSYSECPMTADFVYEDFSLSWKGQPDINIKEILIIDFKILAGDLSWYLEKFKYEEQVRGYMIPTRCPDGIIAAYNKKRKKVELKSVKQNHTWWNNKILSHGRPIKVRG